MRSEENRGEHQRRGKGAASDKDHVDREEVGIERGRRGEGGERRETKEREKEGDSLQLPTDSKEVILKVAPPGPATPATVSWIRDHLPSQVHCEFLTHKI